MVEAGGGARDAEQEADGGAHSRVGGQRDARLLPQRSTERGRRLAGGSSHVDIQERSIHPVMLQVKVPNVGLQPGVILCLNEHANFNLV